MMRSSAQQRPSATKIEKEHGVHFLHFSNRKSADDQLMTVADFTAAKNRDWALISGFDDGKDPFEGGAAN
jgi:hypothetical protein